MATDSTQSRFEYPSTRSPSFQVSPKPSKKRSAYRKEISASSAMNGR
jgi:hypothetical protein